MSDSLILERDCTFVHLIDCPPSNIFNRQCACRFLLVESINKPQVVSFYERNGFSLLYSSERDEIDKTHRKLDEDGHLSTRLMMLDLNSVN